MFKHLKDTKEHKRLKESDKKQHVFHWHKWGPYVSERSWGTIREDYSENGDAWGYFTHDMAKSKTFRWGEDGLAGICDRYQLLCVTFAFWNKKDRILKERLFGVSPSEGNHGEDVKEYYYYLDNTPSHSYMKFLYKYPQQAFPYEKLVEENQSRKTSDREFELIDTGIFDDEKYFDIFVEYAKNTPDDIAIKVEVFNRGDEDAPIDVIPQLTFRKSYKLKGNGEKGPEIKLSKTEGTVNEIVADNTGASNIEVVPFEYSIGRRYFYGEGDPLFTNNESNFKLLNGKDNQSEFVKDAFHRYIVSSEKEAVNPSRFGTKACLHIKDQLIPAKSSKVFYFRFTGSEHESPLEDVEQIIQTKKQEADEFYASFSPKDASEEVLMIQRQALSGMLWSKQFYNFDVDTWLKGDIPGRDMPVIREEIRNKHWKHLLSLRILSMPDKWEYPWFAAWDLAFHTVSLALVDLEFAKEQLWLLLFDQFQHPNGQIPAYEWEFSEMNPPVQGWAILRIFNMEFERTGKKDYAFLKKCFQKLVINFVWWVNKVDAKGNNVFEGGFLGLDNITIIDRSSAIPGGGMLEQSDGTGWMGMFCLVLMRMAIELAMDDKEYETMATKFFEHYVYIAAALHHAESREVQIWNEEDGFFYDVISFPNGTHEQILVRSLVGIIPLYAIDVISEEELDKLPEFKQNFMWFLSHRKDIVDFCVTPFEQEGKKKYLLALMKKDQMKKVLSKVWDKKEFRSDFGLRSLSKIYEKNPYILLGKSITYEPAEAVATLKGGNSNWRGPIWFPTTFLFIDSLKKLDKEFGDDFVVDTCGEKVTAGEMAEYFAKSLVSLFEKDAEGKRPIFGDCKVMQEREHWKDHILFYEHFHGDTGRGLGASHQTGWSGLVASLIDEWFK
ncbi:MAG: hypothetical protein S4CHLAM37_14800 [Chlamydiia bacterium]|nr:hypothetical protein [Chlamydiia bacterium]